MSGGNGMSAEYLHEPLHASPRPMSPFYKVMDPRNTSSSFDSVAHDKVSIVLRPQTMLGNNFCRTLVPKIAGKAGIH